MAKEKDQNQVLCMVMPSMLAEMKSKGGLKCACKPQKACPCKELFNDGQCECHIFINVSGEEGVKELFRAALKKEFNMELKNSADKSEHR